MFLYVSNKRKEIQAVDSVDLTIEKAMFMESSVTQVQEKYVSSCDEFAAETNSRRSHCQSDESESALPKNCEKKERPSV